MESRRAARKLVLLLSHDPAWVDAVRGAVAQVGRTLVQSGSPEDTMARLGGRHEYAHLVVDAASAGAHLDSLVEMTCGEAESGVDIVLLGQDTGYGDLHEVAAPDPALIASALELPPGQCHGAADAPFDPALLAPLLATGALHVRFQPLVRLSDCGVAAFEVLARVKLNTCNTLSPQRFVPMIERLGLSQALLREVAGAGLDAAPRLAGAALAINLPLDVVLAPETRMRLDAQRATAGVASNQVIIELTESQRVTDIGRLQASLEGWRASGYQLAIDDAGPDLPDHRALFGLPFHWVKLDKSVVGLALRSEAGRRYMAQTVAVAKAQGLSVIAEGVENQAAWDLLDQLGVDVAQGFMVGRPLPLGAVGPWRDDWVGTGSGALRHS